MIPGLPVIDLENARPGDAVMVQGQGFYSACISVGQRLQLLGLMRGLFSFLPGIARRLFATESAYCRITHIAGIVGYVENVAGDRGHPNNWSIIAAGGSGVHIALLSSIPEDRFVVVPLEAFPTIDGHRANRGRVVAFLKHEQGRHYGFFTIASIVVNLFTPRLVDFRRDGTYICSALYARAGEHGGVLWDTDPFQIVPAEVGLVAACGG